MSGINTEILIAVLSLAGTCIGSAAGILAANKLTVYRIEQLEKKVEKHNHILERYILLENNVEQMMHIQTPARHVQHTQTQ